MNTVWTKLLEWLAGRGIAWAQRKLDEREQQLRAESEAIHKEVQAQDEEAERRRLVDP